MLEICMNGAEAWKHAWDLRESKHLPHGTLNQHNNLKCSIIAADIWFLAFYI